MNQSVSRSAGRRLVVMRHAKAEQDGPTDFERVLAETAASGKSDFDLDAEVVDEAGTVVARTHGRYQLRTF